MLIDVMGVCGPIPIYISLRNIEKEPTSRPDNGPPKNPAKMVSGAVGETFGSITRMTLPTTANDVNTEDKAMVFKFMVSENK